MLMDRINITILIWKIGKPLMTIDITDKLILMVKKKTELLYY